jgi:hypothetical protein
MADDRLGADRISRLNHRPLSGPENVTSVVLAWWVAPLTLIGFWV